MGKKFIEFSAVSKIYKKGKLEVPIYENIGISIPKGEFVAIMGPSGCGKTTLLNMMGGIDRCTSGTIRVNGHTISEYDESQLADWRAQELGFIFQFYNLMPVLSAADNVELPLLLKNLTPKERKKKVDAALEIVGLLDRRNHFPSELSGGQEQRVAIARAIVSDPVLLLADEPTGDLDRKTATETMQLLQQLNQVMGKTIVMVTHDMSVREFVTHTIDFKSADLSNYQV
jgi:putative ABC transport system ATP-binding protein